MDLDLAAAPSILPWGEFEIPAGEWRRWRVGLLTLWIQRQTNEWRLAWQEEIDGDPGQAPAVNQPAPDGPSDTAKRERIASHRMGDQLMVSARLADRSVVVRPETRFRISPHGEVEFYIGTPLWIFLETSEPRQRLLDIPTRRPSDTWFGPSTVVGELCYAGHTAARLHLDNLPIASHLAITRVLLHNHGDDDLLLERLNLPVPHLALFAGANGSLWTQTVSVYRDASGKLAEVRIEDGPPPEMEASYRHIGPRLATERGVLSRALSALLG